MGIMRATDLITAAYNICFDSKREIHEAWITHSEKIGEIAGAGHIVNAQDNGRLDLLLRQMDEEATTPRRKEIDFSLTIRASFSDYWLLRAYEIVRAADEQLKLKNDSNERITALKRRMALIRIPIAKAQIQGKPAETKRLILAHADGSDRREYTNDGSYMAPRGICSETGSAVWLPVDAATRQTAQIRRIDLSNKLLRLFD